MAYKVVGNLLSRWKLLGEWRWLLRFLLLSFFIIFITGFLHFREVRVDPLEHNATAKKYILAQVGFEFPDMEATRILKEESMQDIGKFYYFQDDEILAAEKEIHRELIKNPKWRAALPNVTFENLLSACDEVRDLFLKLGIADARTVIKMRGVGPPFDGYPMLVFTPELPKGVIPEEVWETFGADQTPAFNFILQKFGKRTWTWDEDLGTQHSVRQLVKASVPLKMTKVEPGSRIINAGERVTLRHLDMLKAMKKALSQQQFKVTPLTLIGSLALSVGLTLIGLTYFRTFHPRLLRSFSKMGLIGAIILITLSLAKLTEYLIINNSGVAEWCRYPIFVFFATLLVSVLIDKTVALVVSGFIAMILTISLAIEYHHFLIINLSVSMMTLFLFQTVRKRKEIFVVCGKVWLMTLPLLVAMNLLEDSFWDYHLLADFATTLGCIAASGLLVVAIIPLLESAFGVVTDMTIMEAGDPSHPLLRRLSLEAPGTYQHSLSVAVLAEEAALAIKANAIHCRVAALYHDIGKLFQPQYFTENSEGFNMHQLLTPLESAQLIINHVTEGVKLAQQHELPSGIIDVIREHHGTCLVYYFFHAQMEQCRPLSIAVEETQFRYPGPIPRSRESAIVMIADSVEAAFRSLDETTEKAIVDLVENIVHDKIRQKQFNASHMTFNEIDAVKKAIVRTLVATSHGRVKYPETTPGSSWKEEGILVKL